MVRKLIVIGNYLPDKQFSMQSFEVLMAKGYSESGYQVDVIRPKAMFIKFAGDKSNQTKKWLGYVDKFVLFPFQLLLLRTKYLLFFKKVKYHICDHSNAIYLHLLPKNKTLISCHDVLAIRAGLGFEDTYCTATKTGELLQRLILKSLSAAHKIACVSEFTLKQLIEIDTRPNLKKEWISIHNAVSKNFVPMSSKEITQTLLKFDFIKGKSFILHVGSDLIRKNRGLLVKLIYELQNDWDGVLVLAGASLNSELVDLIVKLKLDHRVVEIIRPSDKEIIALYSSCQAMIFPSYSEGFGWPIIEAQACGAPVITSNKAPMMSEVGGRAALYANPDDVSAFANQFRKLFHEEFRLEMIQMGYKNAKRFDLEQTLDQYIELIEN